MKVFELSHLFYHFEDEVICSPKNLGLFCSLDSAEKAKAYFCTQPGFRENQDTFSIRERNVIGNITDGVVFEALIYFHSEDYEIEHEIELGLYGEESVAQGKLYSYCEDNPSIINSRALVLEKIVNKCIIGRKEWSEGFLIRVYE